MKKLRSLLLSTAAAAMTMVMFPVGAQADIAVTTPAGRAATWLMAQATNGQLASAAGDTDWGLTADAVLGLSAAGATSAQLNPFVASLEDAVRTGRYGYLGSSRLIDTGSVAKLVHVANLAGRNPGSFGGEDLVADLKANIAGGLLSGANTFGQAYAILGLRGAGQDTAALVEGLVRQQCPAGDFRLSLASTACTTPAADADRDATAIATTALRSAGEQSASAKAAKWLVSDQLANGSWIGSRTATPAQNTNTTGLAAQALKGGEVLAVARATGFAVSLQLKSGTDAGAVAYDQAAFTAATNGQISNRSRYQWTRATAQALLALVNFNVYTTPGTHTVNGREWRTTCEPYSQTGRCTTLIWSTQVIYEQGTFRKITGWVFNNLTYLPGMTRAQWAQNPLANAPSGKLDHYWHSAGRSWRTECDTPNSGRGGCRAYIESDVVVTTGTTYSTKKAYVFNNIVLFKN